MPCGHALTASEDAQTVAPKHTRSYHKTKIPEVIRRLRQRADTFTEPKSNNSDQKT
jgi:hypothetical protein